MDARFLPLGDTAFTVEFGDRIAPELLAAVQALDLALEALHAAGRLPGLVECVPTFRSLTLIYDPLATSAAALQASVAEALSELAPAPRSAGRLWRLPVCYEGEAAQDLADCAAALGFAPEELVARHSATRYAVYMQGFLPGFPFMGDLPEELRLPRRSEPRLRVPAGSVAIATGLTAVYPWESPGGWHLLGRCPVPLFDPAWERPALLAAGDRVEFQPVPAAEYARLAAAFAARELAPQGCLVADADPADSGSAR